MIPYLSAYLRRRRVRKEFRQLAHKLRETRRADDDILSDVEKQRLDGLLAECADAKNTHHEEAFLSSRVSRVAEALAPKKYQRIREYADTLAVAFAVAFGIRGLFAQPFKIPTSSMQPTLYGIHFVEKEAVGHPLLGKTHLPPLETALFSTRRAKLEMTNDGEVNTESLRPVTEKLILTDTRFEMGDRTYQLPGAPGKVAEYSQIEPGRKYRKGDVLCDGYLSTGDHLFVDRVSHYVTGLKRGDVVVFNTEGIMHGARKLADSGFYYIKRLAGMPGDTLKIDGNQLLVRPKGETSFRPIAELDERFEKVYSMKGGYHGHTNLLGGMRGEYLGSPVEEFTVPEDSYFMLGDNSYFSSDSRAWGVVPRRNIVGKALWVFWPFSRRWGLADRPGPVEVPTGQPERGTFRSMYLQ